MFIYQFKLIVKLKNHNILLFIPTIPTIYCKTHMFDYIQKTTALAVAIETVT